MFPLWAHHFIRRSFENHPHKILTRQGVLGGHHPVGETLSREVRIVKQLVHLALCSDRCLLKMFSKAG